MFMAHSRIARDFVLPRRIFISGIVTGSCARSSRNRTAAPPNLIPVDSVDALQAVEHRLFQIVAGAAVFRVAPGEVFLLLALELARLLRRQLLGDCPDIRSLNLAIEIG